MKSYEPRTFRATAGAWIGELSLPVFFFAVLFITAVSRLGLSLWLAAPFLAVLVIIAASEYLFPMLRSWITLDRSMIEGSVNGRQFHMYYAEILASWIIERRRRRFLCLGTATGTIIFPLHFFDDFAIWSEVSLRLPQESLGDQAILRLPDYQSWASERPSTFRLDETPRAVTDLWLLQVLGWGGLMFALFCAIAGFRGRNIESMVGFIAISLACVTILFRWGITELSTSHVKRSTLFSSYMITWKEVVRIEKDPLGMNFVLIGDGCQLVIPGPIVWSTLGKKSALDLFEAQIRLRSIPMHKTILALVKISRRTRMAS
jgi:hypothetical protein